MSVTEYREPYRLIEVNADGKVKETSVQGYHAESVTDKLFHDALSLKPVGRSRYPVFVMVLDYTGAIRHFYSNNIDKGKVG